MSLWLYHIILWPIRARTIIGRLRDAMYQLSPMHSGTWDKVQEEVEGFFKIADYVANLVKPVPFLIRCPPPPPIHIQL
jgi:hypothetical protein